MITRDELEEQLDQYLMPSEFKDYGPNGLQVGGKESIHKVATCVTASVRSIAKAISEKCDALIVHHGIFWQNDSMVVRGSKRARLTLLLENRLSLFAYHLPLDAHREIGNNWAAARAMGWQGLKTFADIGVIGDFPETDVPTFVKQLEKFYDHSATKALGGPPTFSRAALLSGGGYRYLKQAVDAGVDCFITGNFDEPAWHVAHEEGIHFFAMGHSATERIGPIKLASWLQKTVGVEAIYIQDDNPF